MPQISILARIIRLLARSGGGAGLLPQLHEHLVETCGGVSSLMVHEDDRPGMLRASSGWGIPHLPLEAWTPEPAERTAIGRAQLLGHVVAVEAAGPRSRIGQLLAAPVLVVAPLVAHDGSRGAVLVGTRKLPLLDEIAEGVLAATDAFVLALDRARSNREADLRADVDRLLLDFAASTTGATRLNHALVEVCRASARVFAASHVSAWLHDREARDLVRAAASDSGHGQQPERVAVADALSPAAAALHRSEPEMVAAATGMAGGETARTLTVPLRGRRRALGVLQLDGVNIAPDDHARVLAAAGVLGRGVAMSIEAVVLLEHVVLGHWRLEGLLDATEDMTVLCDAELRVVRGNEAFAACAGLRRDELAGRELRDVVGDSLAAWAHETAVGPHSLAVANERGNGPFGADVRVEAVALGGKGAGGLVLVARSGPSVSDSH